MPRRSTERALFDGSFLADNVSQTASKSTNVISTLGVEPREIEINFVVLDQPVIEDILKSNEATKYYNSSDLERASDWLHQKQNIFGVGEVFRLGVSIYLRNILKPWM